MQDAALSKPSGVSYQRAATVGAAVFAAVAALLWGGGDLLLLLFSLEPSVTADIMMGRAGVLFVAFASLLWASRTAPPSALRRQVAFSVVLAMLGLVLFGMIEWLSGRVGAGITLAIGVELLVVALFLPHAQQTGDENSSES